MNNILFVTDNGDIENTLDEENLDIEDYKVNLKMALRSQTFEVEAPLSKYSELEELDLEKEVGIKGLNDFKENQKILFDSFKESIIEAYSKQSIGIVTALYDFELGKL